MGIASAAKNAALRLRELRFQIAQELCLGLRLHKVNRLAVHAVHRLVAPCDNALPNVEFIDRIAEVGEHQRRVLCRLLYALFHLTPSLVSSSKIPIAVSSARISSARA